MDPLVLNYENLHLRVDRGIFELFDLSTPSTTFRVPLPWLGVLIDYKKPDRPGKPYFGAVSDSGAALYGTDKFAFRYSTSPVERVPPGHEPLFRTYFTQVAALVDRRVR
ncbi:hypothetical protein AB0O01_02505 [Streptomyces sp. NPDC093252]|uniref:hypothetical protein n=1 Tax=Streptomyces sp. NPDC093252 TaxID=3154980 RepID=UPI00341A3226